ncbi:MAG: hypothetical protein CMN37_05935, partial [SAR116 cluster bacterium]|nr:hypothetical protein [SAR116 cluster bacterium]
MMIIKFLLYLIFLFPILASAQVKFVEVTGRAVIEEEAPLLSKNSALEDALYLAALQGGAKIAGYSIVDNFTNLKEQIVVRPTSGILDYNIIDEMISDQHYEVTIKALVGQRQEKVGCSARPKSTLISFAPKVFVNQQSPAWSQYLPQNIYNNILGSLSEFENLKIINASNTSLNDNNKKLKLNDFDYNVLTGNIVNYQPADFALETNILIEPTQHLHSTNLSTLQLEDYLKVTTKVIIKDINSNKEVFTTSRIAMSYIGPRKTLFKTINVLSRPNRDNIITSLISSVSDLPEEINENLKCINLISIAQPSRMENSIKIDLGLNQGISQGNLALSESDITPFAVFEVVKA